MLLRKKYKNDTLKKSFGEKYLPPISAKNTGLNQRADINTPIELAEYAVVDTELTGLDIINDSIISIGGIRINGSKISLGDFFYRVVHADTCSRKSVVIHGITPSESEVCPNIEAILPEFISYCGSRVIVGHFVAIDGGFINKEMKRLYGSALENRFVDTYKIYRWLCRRRENPDAFYEGDAGAKSLLQIANEFGIYADGLHNAICDAFITAQLFQRFIYLLKQEGIKTLSDLMRIGGGDKKRIYI
ncbi:MAG: 3'-5' exonuclease [Nitrospirae bacterium]|nr:3'-5' exonuclease [Nitrospirota bacterium]